MGYLVQGGTPPDASVSTDKIVDDAVTLAKMAAGTDGNIISYDASGNPVAVATGTDGQVLTSSGAGAVCAFEDAAGGAWSVMASGTFSADSTLEVTGMTKTIKVFLSLMSTTSGGWVGPYVRTSTDNGTSYDSGSTDYTRVQSRTNAGGNSSSQSDGSSSIGTNVSNNGASWNRGDMEVTVVDPQETVGATMVDINWMHVVDNLSDADAVRHGRSTGYRKSSTDTDAIEITFGTACNGRYVVMELN